MEGARFKYEFLNGRVRYVVDENGVTNVYEVWPDSEPRLLPPSPYIMARGADIAAMRLGIPFDANAKGRVRQTHQVQVGNTLLRAFEDESVPKRYVGGWLYEATVKVADHTLDIIVNVFNRTIMRVTPRVQKFATIHAIDRAKERYGLVLDAEAAEAMIKKLIAGDVTPQPGGHSGKERAEVVYDQEVFTVVWNPEDAMIITVTPTGGYRQTASLFDE